MEIPFNWIEHILESIPSSQRLSLSEKGDKGEIHIREAFAERIESRASRATAPAECLRLNKNMARHLRGDDSGNWHQRAKTMKSKGGHPTCVGEHWNFSADPKLMDRIETACCQGTCELCPFHLRKRWVSLATRKPTVLCNMRGESWRRRFHTDNKQFKAEHKQAQIAMHS